MNKLIKSFLLIFIFIMSISFVYAAEDEDLSPTSQTQLNTQKDAIDKYCSENISVEGCVYDKNNSLYKGTHEKDYYAYFPSGNYNLTQTFKIPANISLTRGYQTFDGNGNAIFAGCYRYNGPVTIAKKKSSSIFSSYENVTENATLFVFEIVYGDKNGKNCGVKKQFVIPEAGLTMSYGKGEFDGKQCAIPNSLMLGPVGAIYEATMNGWTAKHNGDCPKVFGYTANTRWYTSSENKYIFSNDDSDFNITTYSFFGGEAYKTRPGCTVEDVDGKEKAQELLNKVLREINNKSCPAKIEDMSSFQDNLESWYENLRKDNEYRVLWSAGLIDEVTKQSAEVQIKEAIHKKISSCQYKICNISDSQRQIVEANLGDKCKNGCTLTNVRTPSESENAKCYCCGGSQGCTYQWTENAGSSCALQNNISKDQCIGTTTDLACRKCLVDAYEKAKLTDEQKSCMAGSEIAKLLTEDNLDKQNEEAADQDKDKEIEENRELREDIYQRLGQPLELNFDFEIPEGDISSCVDLLGPNLTALVKVAITILQIVGAIIAIVKGMMTLIPPILAKDAEALKKASNVLVKMAIILVVIFLLRPLLRFIGSLLDFDISCIF